ncbi:CKLF-like MARVEL transmembrane domain-containing protein 7 [Tachyglossus aculeatus]|uniref:CKLF-like MARVEL transmembrane domain-containing protein 7 n=1 Tax=Tachyglossus aculeatus TaxID=9261 RepID=UPI0018F46755|nr:CKLF-like MARVEL transmembrane domain-containing protein 7 [Tachyglossus aculeatus]
MSHGAGLVRTTAGGGGGGGGDGAPPPPAAFEGPDLGYTRSSSAMLKIGQMVTLLIGFICVRSSPWTEYSTYGYYEVVTICDLLMILIFYLVHVFRIYKMLTCISWPLAEYLHYLIGTILLLIASFLAALKSHNISGLVAGAVFGFIATFLCTMSIWFSYKISCITQATDAAA